MIEDLRTSGKRAIHLTIRIKLVSKTDPKEKHVMLVLTQIKSLNNFLYHFYKGIKCV